MKRKKPVYILSTALAALALLCLVGCPNQASSGDIPVTGITLNPAACKINVGTSYQLSTILSPTNASAVDFTWASSDPAVATVSPSGLVTAGVTGTTTITAATTNGGKTASCELTVSTFFAGYYHDGSKAVPCYWEGMSLISLAGTLTREAYAISPVVVAGGTVYIAGQYYDGSKYVPCYWKGATLHSLAGGLTGEASAYALTVSGGTVYTAGQHNNGSKYVPCYWEGTSLHELVGGTHNAAIISSQM